MIAFPSMFLCRGGSLRTKHSEILGGFVSQSDRSIHCGRCVPALDSLKTNYLSASFRYSLHGRSTHLSMHTQLQNTLLRNAMDKVSIDPSSASIGVLSVSSL